jgi:hypothetical protein
MKPIGLSETPTRERVEKGKPKYYGESAVGKVTHSARHVNANPFLEQAGDHIGGYSRTTSAQKPMTTKTEIPTSDQTGVAMPQPISGGAEEYCDD